MILINGEENGDNDKQTGAEGIVQRGDCERGKEQWRSLICVGNGDDGRWYGDVKSSFIAK